MIGRSLAMVILLACIVPPARGQDTRLDPNQNARPDPNQGARLDPNGLHRDTLAAAAPQPFQITPIVLPGSERLLADGEKLDTTQYRLDYRYGRLWVRDAESFGQLVVEYRTLPFQLKELYRRHEPAAADSMPSISEPTEPEPEPLLPSISGLQHSGSITRGILTGSNRDVSLESGLRMQLSGEVAEGVDVQAVLTDENTPILPEGTTQRIEEFDRVFIGIDAPYGRAQLGDIDLQFSESEFGQFERKLQGGSATVSLPPAGGFAGGQVTVAGATSRGIFRSQEIEPIDGMQGPYRLEGAQGEQFVLVVPGSETVYVDGRQLTRGETNDYTIDYATGELSFTPNVIVTADKRIKIEFQYSTTQFTRSLVGTEVSTRFWSDDASTARGRFGVAVIREADSREFSEEFGFGREDSLAVARAGDGVAASGGVQRVEFDAEAPYVQYLREISNGTDTIYVALEQAPADSIPVYRVQFSRVGAGQGSYERVGRSVNGILYEYRGAARGTYLPIRILPKPKRHRLIDFHGALEPVAGFELFGEWGRSVNDENRLSAVDASDDLGDAYVAGMRLKPLRIGPASVSGELRRRFVAGSFASFNRIRPVEFERRWNLPASRSFDVGSTSVDETIDEGNLHVEFLERSSARGELGRIALGDGFEGVRRAGYLVLDEPGLPVLDYRLEVIGSRDPPASEEGRWIRQLGIVSHPTLGGRLTPRFEVEHEDRRQEMIGLDSLTHSSFRFVELRPGVAWEDGTLELGGFIERRAEDDWIDGAVRPAATSWTGQTTFGYRPSSTLDLDGSVGFRSRRFTDRFRIDQNRRDVESLILRLNSGYRPLQQAVQLNVFYEGMTERTPTLQEIYVRTGPEIGQYVWEDVDGDGIVQIDELLPERLPNEGTYVKTFIPSDTLTSVLNVQSRIRLELDPRRLWNDPETRLKRLMSHVATRTVLEVREKTRDPDLASVYLLNLSRFRDARYTMNGRLRVGQDVFLFRTRPNYGLDISFSQLRSLSELAAGEEERFVNSWRAEGRLRPNDRWGLRTVAALEQDRLESAAFDSRRYDISGLRIEPEASYSISDRLQAVTAAAYGHKLDAVGDRRALVVKVPLELRYTRAQKLQATLRGEIAYVDLDGTAFGLAQFELTDGRGPGTSFLWGFRGQYTLNEYLRATFSYDARAPSDASVIHTMQVQLSAIF